MGYLYYTRETVLVNVVQQSELSLNHYLVGDLEEIFRKVIFKLNLKRQMAAVSLGKLLRWISLGLTDDKSTRVQVMAYKPQTEPMFNQFFISVWRH